MGMIPFLGTDSLPPSTGFTRLSRQPDGQGEAFQPLDLPQDALASVTPLLPAGENDDETATKASAEEKAEGSAEASPESAPVVAEQLAAFTHMPLPFVRPEEGVRLSLARPSVEPAPPATGESTRAEPVSPVLRALTRLERLEGDRQPAASVMSAPGRKEVSPLLATELALRLSQPTGQGERPVLPTIAALPPLPGEAAADRELAAVDPKVMAGLPTQPVLARKAEYQWAPARLADSPAQWGQQLVDVLKDRVELQVNQSIKQAHIRLDPPELGRLELTVRVEGDRLNVQLNVTNPAVRDALIQSMERLRMSLAPHHAGGVEVNVGQGGEQERGDRWQQDKILAGRRQWQEEREASSGAGQDWLNTLV